MNKMIRKDCYVVYLILLYLLLFAFTFYSCSEKTAEIKVERSFYYWKSALKLTGFEMNRLDSLHVKTIYLKFFDVDWDASTHQAIPKAKLQVPDKRLFLKYAVIPTVFVTNACMRQNDSAQTILLAGKIYGLIKDICETNHINTLDEIQVDCDWTASTRKQYFSLLRSLKQISNKDISATIRLHQIKFLSKSGVPPADRGLLMCYNMGNLKNPATKNSIIETSELKKYTGNLSSYPLRLDVAFPLFEWKVLFRENSFKGLIENMPAAIFAHSFALKNNGRIEILKDTLLAGYELKKGDVLRTEESDITEVLAAATEINKRLKNTRLRVSFFHLDSVTLTKFTPNELESIYSIFR
ncbi:MAG: hypothetical protein H7Z13_13795 [Ferruginibacter sp.]|nr:hypothetical protein [Ferruginibacter sp.]